MSETATHSPYEARLTSQAPEDYEVQETVYKGNLHERTPQGDTLFEQLEDRYKDTEWVLVPQRDEHGQERSVLDVMTPYAPRHSEAHRIDVHYVGGLAELAVKWSKQ